MAWRYTAVASLFALALLNPLVVGWARDHVAKTLDRFYAEECARHRGRPLDGRPCRYCGLSHLPEEGKA